MESPLIWDSKTWAVQLCLSVFDTTISYYSKTWVGPLKVRFLDRTNDGQTCGPFVHYTNSGELRRSESRAFL